MIGRRGERGSGISMLATRHDDDDEIGGPHGSVGSVQDCDVVSEFQPKSC